MYGIKIKGKQSKVDESTGKWSSDDKKLEEILNEACSIEMIGSSPSLGSPIRRQIHKAVELFGGEGVYPPIGKTPKGIVY